MDDFLRRAAADLHIEVTETGPTTWTLTIPGSLARVFGKETINVTTDKQLVALDPELQLLSPNSSLTVTLAEQLRTRGRPTHRARLHVTAEPAILLEQVAERRLVEGLAVQVGQPQMRLLLRITYRIRFEREVVEEKMVACCVDYETGEVWPAITDITPLRELLTPLPTTALTEEHVSVALMRARRWLELTIYPQKVMHEAELSQLLMVEQARITAFYDALEEDSGLAMGGKEDEEEGKGTTLDDERKRLLEEQEYRYALSLAAETVSVATIQAAVIPIGTESQPGLMIYCPLFAPALQPPHCAMCGRAAPVALAGDRLLCNVCRQVA
jgi:hypothetical protein